MGISPGPHCKKVTGEAPTTCDFQAVPFSGAREEEFSPDFVARQPVGFISKGQIKLYRATETKHPKLFLQPLPGRLAEGQLNQANVGASHGRKRAPFCHHMRGTSLRWHAWPHWAFRGRLRTLSSGLTHRSAAGLLQPALLQQEAVAATGRSLAAAVPATSVSSFLLRELLRICLRSRGWTRPNLLRVCSLNPSAAEAGGTSWGGGAEHPALRC